VEPATSASPVEKLATVHAAMREAVVKLDDALVHGRLPAIFLVIQPWRHAVYSQMRLDENVPSLHFRRHDHACGTNPETTMGFIRLVASAFACGFVAAAIVPAMAAEQFPFDQDLVLDAAPMRPASACRC